MQTPELLINDTLQNRLAVFLKRYGPSGLEKALQLYEDAQQNYICKSSSAISRIKLTDIYYLNIREHNISIHTQYDTYHKYGSLNKELAFLSPYGFVKCNQSCIVSLRKIKSIRDNSITLYNNEQLYMSRHYAPKLLIAFSYINVSK